MFGMDINRLQVVGLYLQREAVDDAIQRAINSAISRIVVADQAGDAEEVERTIVALRAMATSLPRQHRQKFQLLVDDVRTAVMGATSESAALSGSSSQTDATS
jgi:hypothetical protein